MNITPGMQTFTTVVNGQTAVIERSQNQGNRLANEFTKTSRPCPPFCIHPMVAMEGLETVGELEGGFDFTDAVNVLMFCNGPWCDQSPRAIANLVDAGYPVDKLKWYRGGMQVWQILGLSTQ